MNGGRETDWVWGATSLPFPTKLRIPFMSTPGVRLWGISSMVERETARTVG